MLGSLYEPIPRAAERMGQHVSEAKATLLHFNHLVVQDVDTICTLRPTSWPHVQKTIHRQ